MEAPVMGQKIDAARQVASMLAAQDATGSIDSIYLAGSIPAGFGNRTSDVDLFVLHSPGPGAEAAVAQYNVRGQRVDVEHYCLDRARQIVDDVIGFDLDRANPMSVHSLPDKIDFTVRLYMSQTVLSSAALEQLKHRVAVSLRPVTQAAINFLTVAAAGHAEDFIGAITDGDFDTAALVGQDLIASAGKALATAAGDLYFARKWLFRQLARNPIDGFPMDKFVTYQRGGWVDGGLAEAEALLFFAQTCLVVSQILGGSATPLAAWPSWTATAGSGLWRHPAYCVLRTRDGIMLHWELRRQLLVKEHAAVVWALCDGRAPAAIATDVGLLAEHIPALRMLSGERVDRIIETLQSRGLVRPEPFSVLDMLANRDATTR